MGDFEVNNDEEDQVSVLDTCDRESEVEFADAERRGLRDCVFEYREENETWNSEDDTNDWDGDDLVNEDVGSDSGKEGDALSNENVKTIDFAKLTLEENREERTKSMKESLAFWANSFGIPHAAQSSRLHDVVLDCLWLKVNIAILA